MKQRTQIIDLQKYLEAADKVIRDNSDDLITKENANSKPRDGNAYWGKCYIASESLYHYYGGKDSAFKPMNLKHEGRSHWFLQRQDNNQIIDPTASQYKTMPDYSLAVGRGFLPTKEGISSRSNEFLNRVLKTYNQMHNAKVSE